MMQQQTAAATLLLALLLWQLARAASGAMQLQQQLGHQQC
jgi:hypothetical protein